MSGLLSTKEKTNMQTFLETLLDDECYLGEFVLYQAYTSDGVMRLPTTETSGAVTKDLEIYEYQSGSWATTPTPCIASSQGAGQEMKGSSTYYVQRMKFKLPLNTPVNLPQSYPYTDDAIVYARWQGTWIYYGGIVWYCTGNTVSDSFPTLTIVDAKQDSFALDTPRSVGTMTATNNAGSSIYWNTVSLILTLNGKYLTVNNKLLKIGVL